MSGRQKYACARVWAYIFYTCARLQYTNKDGLWVRPERNVIEFRPKKKKKCIALERRSDGSRAAAPVHVYRAQTRPTTKAVVYEIELIQ